MSSQGSSSIPQIMVFRPTLDEMKNFSAYIEHMESLGAHKAGLAKVIPPKEYIPARSYDPVQNIVIPAPISQFVSGSQGLFTQYNIQKKPMTVSEFKTLAESDRYKTPKHTDFDDLERKYWKNITYNSPIYGADISGSVTDADQHIWNINSLCTILDVVEAKQGIKIEGVNTAYLYFGMWKTTFAWHTEDMDLYSINYLHFGAPKSWYAIPPEHGKRLERLAAGFFPSSFQGCSNFLRHKMTLISPHILRQYSIPYNKITQEAGEFMITFPYGYHAGFNHGFNCAESTNFGSLRWIEFGKRAMHTICQCRRDNVKIGMDIFVKEYQPHRYEAWKAGKDIRTLEEVLNHFPEKPKRLAAVQAAEQTSPDSHKRKQSPLKRHPLSQHSKSPHSPKKLVKKAPTGRKRGRPPKNPIKVKPVKKEKESDHNDKATTATRVLTFEDTEQPKTEQHLDDRVEASVPLDLPPELDKYSQEEPIPRYTDGEEIPHLDRYPLDAPGKEHREKKKKKKSKKKELTEAEKEEKQRKKEKKRKKKEKAELLSMQSEQATMQMPEIIEVNKTEEDFDEVDEPPQLTIVTTQLDVPTRTERLPTVAAHSKSQKRIFELGSDDSTGEAPKKKKKQSDDANGEKKKKKKRRKRDDLSGYIASNQPATTTDDNTSADEAAIRSDSSDSLSLLAKKGMPFRRHPITKPPKSPLPVAKQDVNSEEEVSSGSDDQLETWAKPYQGLWTTQPFNFELEKTHNAKSAQRQIQCSVCQLFQPIKESESTNKSNSPIDFGLPMNYADINQHNEVNRTTVHIPEMCYASNPEGSNSTPLNSNDLVDDEGKSALLQCASCKVAVHASCYGELNWTHLVDEEWRCRRCASEAWDAVCCLCCLRGGALKPTTDGRWAHMVCAIAIPDVAFEHIGLREPVNVTKIRQARLKLRCTYCHSILKSERPIGACIQCSHGKCCMSFHTTCAHAVGVTMEAADWPYSVYVTCQKHANTKDMNQNRPLPEIKIGQKVIAKHKNRRYYHAEVCDTTQQIFYHVDFDDGSYSDNLFPYDITNRDCERYGPPPEGSIVNVKWPDGVIYSAMFRGYHTMTLYQVSFEDGSVTTLKREDLYIENESLPRRVRAKLLPHTAAYHSIGYPTDELQPMGQSTATDMRHSIFYSDPVVTDKHRNVYSRYAKPFIMALSPGMEGNSDQEMDPSLHYHTTMDSSHPVSTPLSHSSSDPHTMTTTHQQDMLPTSGEWRFSVPGVSDALEQRQQQQLNEFMQHQMQSTNSYQDMQ
ncbi:lysine-specific demethylase 4C-like [Glandiceps talaboti]